MRQHSGEKMHFIFTELGAYYLYFAHDSSAIQSSNAVTNPKLCTNHIIVAIVKQRVHTWNNSRKKFNIVLVTRPIYGLCFIKTVKLFFCS